MSSKEKFSCTRVMSSPPNSDEKKELSSFYPPLGEDNNGSEQTHQDIPKHIVENEPKKGSYAPITDQPASVNIQDNGQGASEEDHLVQNQEFSSQFCECDVDCCKAYFCPCMSIFSTEKELSNEKKGIGLKLSSALVIYEEFKTNRLTLNQLESKRMWCSIWLFVLYNRHW